MPFLTKYKIYLAPAATGLLILAQYLFHFTAPLWIVPALAAVGMSVYRLDLANAGAGTGWKSHATALILAAAGVAESLGVPVSAAVWELLAAAGFGSLGHALNKASGVTGPNLSGAGRAMPVLAFLAIGSMFLGGCSSISLPDIGGATSGPDNADVTAKKAQLRDTLAKIKLGVTLAEIGYDGFCTSSLATSACTDPRAVDIYIDAKVLIAAAFKSADDALSDGNFDQAKITALIADAVDDLGQIERMIADLKTGNRPTPLISGAERACGPDGTVVDEDPNGAAPPPHCG